MVVVVFLFLSSVQLFLLPLQLDCDTKDEGAESGGRRIGGSKEKSLEVNESRRFSPLVYTIRRVIVRVKPRLEQGGGWRQVGEVEASLG